MGVMSFSKLCVREESNIMQRGALLAVAPWGGKEVWERGVAHSLNAGLNSLTSLLTPYFKVKTLRTAIHYAGGWLAFPPPCSAAPPKGCPYPYIIVSSRKTCHSIYSLVRKRNYMD